MYHIAYNANIDPTTIDTHDPNDVLRYVLNNALDFIVENLPGMPKSQMMQAAKPQPHLAHHFEPYVDIQSLAVQDACVDLMDTLCQNGNDLCEVLFTFGATIELESALASDREELIANPNPATQEKFGSTWKKANEYYAELISGCNPYTFGPAGDEGTNDPKPDKVGCGTLPLLTRFAAVLKDQIHQHTGNLVPDDLALAIAKSVSGVSGSPMYHELALLAQYAYVTHAINYILEDPYNINYGFDLDSLDVLRQNAGEANEAWEALALAGCPFVLPLFEE
jgi:hypothetical protein